MPLELICSCNSGWLITTCFSFFLFWSKSVPGITAKPREDNLRHFDVTLEGPADSPYEGMGYLIHRCLECLFIYYNQSLALKLTSSSGGIFKLQLFLPEDYPMAPPQVLFQTKIYHPNIDGIGRICLDVLKSMTKTSLASWAVLAEHTAPASAKWNKTNFVPFNNRKLVSSSTNPHHSPLDPGIAWGP